MLIIDTREAKLVELIKHIPDFKIPYSIENLQIGDIIIRHNVSGKTFNIIIERKCVNDMIASIKDGRYKEQKIRLLAEVSNNNNDINRNRICYILEGTQSELRLPQDKPMFNGSIISSIFRDNIPILRTFNIKETVEIITRLHDRLLKDCNDFFPIIQEIINPSSTSNTEINSLQIENNSSYLQNIKKCKKDNITPTNWNIMCYMNIPGISNNIAIKIAENYPTLKSLIEAYEKCSTEAEKELLISEIILTETDKQKRRIGNVISKRIYEYIFS